jgi:hypothetical protein
MRRRVWILIVVVLMGALVVSATAAATAKIDMMKVKPTTTAPTPTTSTTTAVNPMVTCQDWVDNGAVWYVPERGVYTVDRLPACIDLSEFTGVTNWEVSWDGTVLRGSMKGIAFQFESQPGRKVHARQVATTLSDDITMTVGNLPIGNGFKFVAMPHSGDKWTNITITVTPLNP